MRPESAPMRILRECTHLQVLIKFVMLPYDLSLTVTLINK